MEFSEWYYRFVIRPFLGDFTVTYYYRNVYLFCRFLDYVPFYLDNRAGCRVAEDRSKRVGLVADIGYSKCYIFVYFLD